MEFKSTKGIFQQIGDDISERILSGELKSGDRVPSVRELAASLGVNQNTIMRTFMELQRDEIVENKRGIGYFVSANALEIIREKRKNEFLNNDLPDFIKQIKLLNINQSELKELIDLLTIKNKSNEENQ